MNQTESVFDVSSWGRIDAVLPNDEELKRIVLNDFIWFMNRPRSFKTNKDKIDDYMRHLRLKKNATAGVLKVADKFKQLDLERIENCLLAYIIA